MLPKEVLAVLRDPPCEETLIKTIKDWLITPNESRNLALLGLSIWDVVNGYYPANNKVVAAILGAWNDRIGEQIFTLLL